ncbi:MAG TPA: DUF2723 domain-containing protein [Longimicrobiales bacterium]|nr:DUF2723 domain-containing protein [Longimicrobiales bacterium]
MKTGVRSAARSARLAERAYAALLFTYPPGFRAEYGVEMRRVFRDRWRERAVEGVGGGARLWMSLLGDLARSAPRERLAVLGERRRRSRVSEAEEPPYRVALLAGLAVWLLYGLTLAPSTAFWDASEYITAAHILGIPHPPGNPLFVLLAHAWELLLSPLDLPVAVRINLFSATMSAAAHGLWFLVADRALARPGVDPVVRRVGAAAAVLLSATAFTVWNQSNVNEKVYTISLFTVALVSWLALRWRDTGRKPRSLLLIALVLGLTVTNHLMGLLAAPALLLFVAMVDRRSLLRPRLWGGAALLFSLGLSVQLFLPLRAKHRPIIAEAEPACASLVEAAESIYTPGARGCPALSASLRREQYGKPPLGMDPTVYPQQKLPRGPELVAAQAVNYAQYFDWQWGRSLGRRDPLFGGVRPLLTLLFLALGLVGALAHWRSDRAGAAYVAVLFVTLSAGLVVYLNFKYGYSIGLERFPDRELHEVRERDYFFLLGFSVWGVWAGLGLAELWRRTADALRGRMRRPRLAAAPLLGLALLPLALNWRWASRAEDYTARDWAYNVLMSVEPYGVLFTNGDNDTFPLWYLQEVEGIRRDVTVLVSSYLQTPWYVKQARDLSRPCPPGISAEQHPRRIICQRPFRAADLPAPLAAVVHPPAQPPKDSVVPLSDAEIERIAGSYFVAERSMPFEAGRVRAHIEPGTLITAADTFVAAILQATLGERPIHFMPATSSLARLGLLDYTVREGLTLRLYNGPVPAGPDTGIVPLPPSSFTSVAGAYVDVSRTDTLLWDVALRRGRIVDPDAPWADAAASSILMQYAYAHYSAAEAHAQLGDEPAAKRHAERAKWWSGITGD